MLRALVMVAVMSFSTLAVSQGAKDGRLPSAPPDLDRAAGEKACSPDAKEHCRNVLSQRSVGTVRETPTSVRTPIPERPQGLHPRPRRFLPCRRDPN